jgi:hypothetical protein
MKIKKTLEQEINDFLEKWDINQMCAFMHDVMPLMELYNVDENNDWVKDIVGESNEKNVRLIRTVYLVSKIVEFHSSIMAHLKMNFKDLYKRMEKHVTVEVNKI